MRDKIRLACVQLTSGTDKAANLEKAERLVARAAATGADVVALPEKWNAIGDPGVLHDAAEPIDGGESVEAMRGWAKQHGVTLVGGSITERREGREKLSNTSLVFDPAGELSRPTGRSTSSTSTSAARRIASPRPKSLGTRP